MWLIAALTDVFFLDVVTFEVTPWKTLLLLIQCHSTSKKILFGVTNIFIFFAFLTIFPFILTSINFLPVTNFSLSISLSTGPMLVGFGPAVHCSSFCIIIKFFNYFDIKKLFMMQKLETRPLKLGLKAPKIGHADKEVCLTNFVWKN